MQLIIIKTQEGRFSLIDLNDACTETVALLGQPTYVFGQEHGTGVEVDGYFQSKVG
jgi:hypothetical protein